MIVHIQTVLCMCAGIQVERVISASLPYHAARERIARRYIYISTHCRATPMQARVCHPKFLPGSGITHHLHPPTPRHFPTTPTPPHPPWGQAAPLALVLLNLHFPRLPPLGQRLCKEESKFGSTTYMVLHFEIGDWGAESNREIVSFRSSLRALWMYSGIRGPKGVWYPFFFPFVPRPLSLFP